MQLSLIVILCVYEQLLYDETTYGNQFLGLNWNTIFPEKTTF